jgi:hypothetical protein
LKALVLAVAIATAEISETPLARRAFKDADRKGRAERKRFTEADLAEMLGDMEPTPEAPPPLAAMPEVDFIRWEPTARREADASKDRDALAA